MNIIMPKVEKYEVCTYDHKAISWTSTNRKIVNSELEKRKFTVVKTFDDIYEARKFIEGNENYVLRYVFKEIESDEPIH